MPQCLILRNAKIQVHEASSINDNEKPFSGFLGPCLITPTILPKVCRSKMNETRKLVLTELPLVLDSSTLHPAQAVQNSGL